MSTNLRDTTWKYEPRTARALNNAKFSSLVPARESFNILLFIAPEREHLCPNCAVSKRGLDYDKNYHQNKNAIKMEKECKKKKKRTKTSTTTDNDDEQDEKDTIGTISKKKRRHTSNESEP